MSLRFEDVFGYEHNTTTEIARGGQGAVFRTQNSNIAVKVELDASGTGFSKDISQNKRLNELRLLPISEKINLTLPQATLKEYAGYVMTLLDDMDSFERVFDYAFDVQSEYSNSWLDGFKEGSPEFVNVIGQYIMSGGRRRRLNAYFKVACAIASLHASGLVYCDFSSKNAFISSSSDKDEVWLIDADNIDYQEKTVKAGYFTLGYGAPEVLMGKGCTFYSDSYAFAVSLFWQLTGTHPFRGALMEPGFEDDFADDAEEKANNGEFPWIMDEEDSSNRINASIQQELVVSERLLKAFHRTFSAEGKAKRHTRPTMYEWSCLLAKELDLSVKCSWCEQDYDEGNSVCPWCDTKARRIELISANAKRSIWKYVHEFNGETCVHVPLRIVNGFKSEEKDEIAFDIENKQGELIVSNLSDKYEWSVFSGQGKEYIEVYGKAQIPPACQIKCVNRATREVVTIEVARDEID